MILIVNLPKIDIIRLVFSKWLFFCILCFHSQYFHVKRTLVVIHPISINCEKTKQIISEGKKPWGFIYLLGFAARFWKYSQTLKLRCLSLPVILAVTTSLCCSVSHSLQAPCWNRKKKKRPKNLERIMPATSLGDPGNVAEMNALQSTLDKPSQWMGYHGKGSWLNIVAYFE